MQLESFFGFLGQSHLSSEDAASIGDSVQKSSRFRALLASTFAMLSPRSGPSEPERPFELRPDVEHEADSEPGPDAGTSIRFDSSDEGGAEPEADLVLAMAPGIPLHREAGALVDPESAADVRDVSDVERENEELADEAASDTQFTDKIDRALVTKINPHVTSDASTEPAADHGDRTADDDQLKPTEEEPTRRDRAPAGQAKNTSGDDGGSRPAALAAGDSAARSTSSDVEDTPFAARETQAAESSKVDMLADVVAATEAEEAPSLETRRNDKGPTGEDDAEPSTVRGYRSIGLTTADATVDRLTTNATAADSTSNGMTAEAMADGMAPDAIDVDTAQDPPRGRIRHTVTTAHPRTDADSELSVTARGNLDGTLSISDGEPTAPVESVDRVSSEIRAQRSVRGSVDFDLRPADAQNRSGSQAKVDGATPSLGARNVGGSADRVRVTDLERASLRLTGERVRIWQENATVKSAAEEVREAAPQTQLTADAAVENVEMRGPTSLWNQGDPTPESSSSSSPLRTSHSTAGEFDDDAAERTITTGVRLDEAPESELRKDTDKHELRQGQTSGGEAEAGTDAGTNTGPGGNGDTASPGGNGDTASPVDNAAGREQEIGEGSFDLDPVDIHAIHDEDGASIDVEKPVDLQHESATSEPTFASEKASGTSSGTVLEMVKRTNRTLQAGTAAWLRSLLNNGLHSLSVDKSWKVLEMQLDEGHGTMTVRARRTEDKVSISVSFSDPQLRALATEHADRLQETLQARYDADVEFSLGRHGSGESTPRQNDMPRGGRAASHAASVQGIPSSLDDLARAARTAAVGARNEWVG